MPRQGGGKEFGQLLVVPGCVEELCAIAAGFVQGDSIQNAVTENRSGQICGSKIGVSQRAMFKEGALHGRSGRVGVVKTGVLDVGVVQPRTSEWYPAQIHMRSLGPDGPTAQVGVRKVESPRTRVGVTSFKGSQSVGEDVRAGSNGSVLSDLLKAGECFSLGGDGQALDELVEECVRLFGRLVDVPSRQRVVLRIG